MKWLKKLATRRIIVLALGCTGIGAAFNPEAVELVVAVVQALGA